MIRSITRWLPAFGLFLISISQPPNLYAQDGVNDNELQFSSVEERRVHATMQQERAIIFEERKELVLRENELKTLEEAVDKKLAEIDVKLTELEKSKQQLAELLSEKAAEEVKKTKDLSKIYEKMDPARAALALSGLEQQLAADILANMKVRPAAKILDSLNKLQASEISKTFSTIQLE